MAFELDVALRVAERLTHGDHDLVPHEVNAGDFLSDRVFHLDAFVHFEEEELPWLSTMNSTVPALV